MRNLPNILPAAAIAAGIALLVACGGGGGGSNPPTTSGPTNPAGPTSGPSTSPTAGPTGSGTPTPTPTPGHSTSPTPTPAPTTTAHGSGVAVHVGFGETNGNTQPLLISSAPNDRGYAGSGNLEPGDKGAVTSGGQDGNGGGGQGGAIDGISCDPTMATDYHVHFFVGIYDNGQQIGLPAGVGMVDPDTPHETINGVPNQSWTATCFYHIHVHDNSGMVHIENPNPQCGDFIGGPTPPPCSQTIFSFGNFLDIWGISLTAANFGPFSGPVQIYTQANPPAPYCTSPCTVPFSSLSLYTGNPASIPLYSHTVVWIVIGAPPASGVQDVYFEEGDP